MPLTITTANSFNELDEPGRQIAAIDGKYIAERTELPFIIQLLSFGSFYVERWYDPHCNAIIKHEAFSDIRRLAPYITQEDLKPKL